jgi:hypothetical protein
VDQVGQLRLVLIADSDDPHSATWNDLIAAQHPCGDAPLCGAQLRYLIGSAHGWLGAVGFGPAAFVLCARDGWIGWSTAARLAHLREVVGLARFLIRTEVRCVNLFSKALALALARLPADWEARYGVRPMVVETFVDRARFTGHGFAAANWQRIGASTGRGRLGPPTLAKSAKDIWVFELAAHARQHLQTVPPPPLTPHRLVNSLAQTDWTAAELASLALGDARLTRRAQTILAARWAQPQASFYGSFDTWAAAKGAYSLIAQTRADVSLEALLAPHAEATQARMAAELAQLHGSAPDQRPGAVGQRHWPRSVPAQPARVSPRRRALGRARRRVLGAASRGLDRPARPQRQVARRKGKRPLA